MKKIDKLIIKAFIGPFIVTFFIALFVLIMQFLWKYIDDLVGKGLEMTVIVKLIFYFAATIVPLALPIAILLSSIMTFGRMGEHYELVALKAAGISLFRFMIPMMACAILLTGVSFAFSNYVFPIAKLKFSALLYAVTKQRPALNLKPGVFADDFEGYVIRVGGKGKDNQTVYDVKIHDHSSRLGNTNVLLAERGEMLPKDGGNAMVFRLYNGVRYEEEEKRQQKPEEQSFTRMHFKEYEMVFDLSNFAFKETDEKLFKNNYRMLNVKELLEAQDSIQLQKINRSNGLRKNISSYFSFIKDTTFALKDSMLIPVKMGNDTSLLACLPMSAAEKLLLSKRATNLARNVRSFTRTATKHIALDDKKVNRYMIEFHNKITLPLACFVLFLVGAPLGAIIRKGGLGMPLVLAIIFFIKFHIISTIGRKLAEESPFWTPFMGMWLATFILLPLGIYLTYQAVNDRSVLNIRISRVLQSLKLIFQKLKIILRFMKR